MIVIDEKFLVIKEINGYLVDMILINSIRSGHCGVIGKESQGNSLPFCGLRRTLFGSDPNSAGNVWPVDI
jgi:hypothetical protein